MDQKAKSAHLLNQELKKQKKIEPASPVIVTKAPNALSPQRRRVQLDTGSESLVEQSHKDDCDINQIIAKYGRDELRDLMQDRGGMYLDLSSMPEYMEAKNIVANATSLFAELPAKLRAEFLNDPARFLAFVQNKDNAEKLLDMGLAKKRPQIDPPASRSDIEKLTDAVKGSKNKAPGDGEK